MPVKRRKARTRRAEWDDLHVIALRTGIRFCGVFNELGPFDFDQAALAWRDLGEDIMAVQLRENPTLRPWAFWKLEHGIDPPRTRGEQRRWLRRRKLLTPAETAMLKANPELLRDENL